MVSVSSCTSCTSEQGGGSELDASLLGCSGVVGLEFNLACFCLWSRDGDMLSGLNGSDLLLLCLGVCVRNLSNDACLPSFAILNVVYNPLSFTKSQKVTIYAQKNVKSILSICSTTSNYIT